MRGGTNRTYFGTPTWVTMDKRLSPYERSVVQAFYFLGDGGTPIQASMPALAELSQCSVGQVAKSVKRLREFGYVRVLPGRKMRTAQRYQLPHLCNRQTGDQRGSHIHMVRDNRPTRQAVTPHHVNAVLKEKELQTQQKKSNRKQASGQWPSAYSSLKTSPTPSEPTMNVHTTVQGVLVSRSQRQKDGLKKKMLAGKSLNGTDLKDWFLAKSRSHGFLPDDRTVPTFKDQRLLKNWAQEVERNAHQCTYVHECHNPACVNWSKAYRILSVIDWAIAQWPLVAARLRGSDQVANTRSTEFYQRATKMLATGGSPTAEALFLFRNRITELYQSSNRG